MRLTAPDAPPGSGAGPFRSLLAEAAAARGGKVELEAEFGFVGRYTPPGGRPRPIFGKALGLNSDSATALAGDKDYAARWLAAAGLPTPSGCVVFSPAYRQARALKNAAAAERLPGTEAALGFAQARGFPVIVKPNRGAEGRGVCRAETEAELARDIETGFATDEQLRVETEVPGRDYRLLVLAGSVVLAYERLPFSVTGDGLRPISALLDDALGGLSATRRGAKIAPDDPRLLRRLASLGYDHDTLLPKGETLELLNNANLSTGGRLQDLTGRITPSAETLAISAADSLGLTLAGVDILAPDLTASSDGATILEVNAGPSLDYYAAESPAHRARALSAVTAMLACLE